MIYLKSKGLVSFIISDVPDGASGDDRNVVGFFYTFSPNFVLAIS